MLILVYGTHDEYNTFIACMETVPELQYRRIECVHAHCFDTFLEKLREIQYDIVIVTVDGAEGMEGIIAAQTLLPETAFIWISNDQGFGVQAHRLGCTYFAVKPITEEILSKAYRAYHGA